MPETIKIILGIFITSFFATVLVYIRPLIGSKIFRVGYLGNKEIKIGYRISGKKFFVTLVIIFLVLLFGFYILLGGLTFNGNGGLIGVLDKMPVSTPSTIGIFDMLLLIAVSFVLVAIPYAVIGRMRGFTRQYLLTVFVFSIVLILIVIAVDKGWHSILRPDVFEKIGIMAFSFYVTDYFMKRRRSRKEQQHTLNTGKGN